MCVVVAAAFAILQFDPVPRCAELVKHPRPKVVVSGQAVLCLLCRALLCCGVLASSIWVGYRIRAALVVYIYMCV